MLSVRLDNHDYMQDFLRFPVRPCRRMSCRQGWISSRGAASPGCQFSRLIACRGDGGGCGRVVRNEKESEATVQLLACRVVASLCRRVARGKPYPGFPAQVCRVSQRRFSFLRVARGTSLLVLFVCLTPTFMCVLVCSPEVTRNFGVSHHPLVE